MHAIRAVTAAVILVCASAVSATAQTVTPSKNTGARAGVRVGYGHGLDWETSIDSPLFADRIRVRGGVGQGRWDSEFDGYRGPIVTRFAASAIYFPTSPPDLRPYIGIGLSRLVPIGVELRPQTAARLLTGVECSGELWTVGAELEIDLPRYNGIDRPIGEDHLYPTARIGIVIRRAFRASPNERR